MRSKAPGEQREDGNPEDIAPALATRFGADTVFTATGRQRYHRPEEISKVTAQHQVLQTR